MGKILWINGAYGSGKTHVADELHRMIPDSFIYDPEDIGYWLHQHQPKECNKANFQDEILWRTFNQKMLYHLATEYAGLIIVPMTLIQETYIQEIIQTLWNQHIQLLHIVLTAGAKIIEQRLLQRDEPGTEWCLEQLPLCLSAFENDCFKYKIDTENRSIHEIALDIRQLMENNFYLQ